MDDPYISRAEHEEFSRRLAEENKRQDKRIEMLEENVREMRALTNSADCTAGGKREQNGRVVYLC